MPKIQPCRTVRRKGETAMISDADLLSMIVGPLIVVAVLLGMAALACLVVVMREVW